jgi:hypothetical protein
LVPLLLVIAFLAVPRSTRFERRTIWVPE